ncbi:unnamed protein product [Cylicocyclus nassatus]|uniref:Uncharacterized protein n=1 Tax=Cylicocyclus nassatus TaxID=53992 RepID=A0AA36GMV2_CYLNA|nr:unnamed protein product [Cylicocyclus nassatus]
MVVFLTNFILDAFGLFADELLLSAAECARQANRSGIDDKLSMNPVFVQFSTCPCADCTNAHAVKASKMLSAFYERRFGNTTFSL